MRGLGLFLIGVGAGLAGAALAGRVGMVAAFVPVVAGLILLATKGRSASDETPAPALRGLGTRVHELLELAEAQAADHVAEGRRQADDIVAQARAEADEIVARARAEAGEIEAEARRIDAD
ncbi:hypothetical protein GCM10010112_23410 [Actinoplanes lobatus]|uniref:Uncharacterized protein n=1 Tax=Actinoplanes lobatus TaxID=113568 RepID=A0A7W7MIF9_9ACTN|nr:hypothetical protein [Actinoplanes lobatus]MBB4751383.1 hypothetical protein [Actinoplanes lobatus]GGN63804.1 hypothetical protein GCM10010112_23410 [Actinoplanes lobatus]GIE40992.1 hypothetical protein Alo02nite_38900 [Actinoplanes lobatus]